MMKHSLMDYIFKEDQDDDGTLDDDHGFLNINNCSQQHFSELLSQSKESHLLNLHPRPGMPKPQTFVEYIIYAVHYIQQKTSNKYRPSGYWRYAIGVYKNLFLVFYFNWFAIFTSPLSSLAFILVYPTLSSALFAFEIGLKIFMDYLGGAKLVERISQDYGHNFSIINWGAPQLLLSAGTKRLIRTTLPVLGKTADATQMKGDVDHRHRTFDVSIAETMTVLSSLIYERQDKKVTKAFKALSDFNKTQQPNQTYEQIELEMKRLVWESEKPIRKIARTYGLHFAGVTELKSLGGPFCGLYWPIHDEDYNQDPFIIVSFKGTTPQNYSEFLVDATLQRTDARAYLFGSAHEGFYDSLFPTSIDSGTDSRDPYYAIQSAIEEKAKQLQKKFKTKKPVQIWVSGHSLGASLGVLLFARWLKCPQDIEPLCELRDAYLIGTPAVGDNDFASIFASHSNAPLTRSSTLWRIINKSDVICRIPPGYNNRTVGHYVPTTDFFNYSHVGHAVQITHPMLNPEPLEIYPSSYQPNLNVDIVVSSPYSPSYQKKIDPDSSMAKSSKDLTANYPWWVRPFLKRVINPIPFVESFYPFFLRDHIPIHYFEGLERARGYYKKEKHV
ncbi:hypothetical protein PS15m_000800 [Mucor circinelloides]